jgi:tetratricopeptide (TPR) repeat protein/transglutaminase-like putative cysteine protease
MLSRFVLSFLLLAASVSGPVTAQSPASRTASPFEGPAFSMPAASLRAASAAIQSDKLSDVTILYEEASYNLSDTGALTYTHRMVYRIETRKGVDDWAESSIDFDPWYQDPSQIHARVLQTDGAFAELDQKTIAESAVNDNEEDTYSSVRQRKAPLPGLAVGAIVEEVVSVTGRKAYAPGGSAYRYYFTDNAPVDRQKVIVDLPVSMPFQERISHLPQLSITRSEANGRRHIEYVQDHQPAAVASDIDLPSISQPSPVVEFATGSSWASVAHEYAVLSDPRILTSQVQSLLPINPAASRFDRIQQLVQRLHKEVRYTGIEFNEAQLIPQPPSEVLKRHYGDCKDKAALLVSMLHAAAIPAHLALLDAATGNDVNPDLPGMNRFNHAIVYVPASSADPALWIDATADFNEVGTLPYMDANRLALIIAPETTGLVATPAATPENSVLVETRSFHLNDLGPAQVTETSETHGYIDANYRSLYGSATTKKVSDDLQNYVETAYLAKSLNKVDHTDGADLSRPFHLTLTVDSARRGQTGLNDAAVTIFPASTLNDLPKWIKTAPAPLTDNSTPEQKEERARKEAQRSPDYHIWPYTYEQRYEITAPAGFTLRALPPDRTTPLGPGTLAEHYSQSSPTLIQATVRFTTGKSTITPQEALDFRQAVADVNRRDAVTLVFEQAGARLLEAGKIKEALAADQDAVLQSPTSALPHVRLARALLSVGVGDMARTEAARAVALDPKSPAALTTQGWILEHDVLGKRFGAGYDRDAAIAAFRKAIPFASEEFDPRFDLAILYEFDSSGVRYSSRANLSDAAKLYRDLIETEKKKNSNDVPQYRINLAYCLLFQHEYKQLDTLLQEIPNGINHSTLAIASAVAQQDAAAGIATADRLNLNSDDRNKGLLSAGNYLAQLGLYAQASDILAAGIQGQKDAPATARQIEMYRKLQRVPLAAPAITSPESLVFSMFNTVMSGTANHKSMAALLTPHAYASPAAFDRDIDKGLEATGLLHSLSANAGISEIVLRDLILGSMSIKSSGDDATGYRVLTQSLGQVSKFFVVKEDGVFRIVADDGSSDDHEVGRYALWALEHNQPKLAKSILDWKRDFQHKGGGDDPFSGALLPRFWTVGSSREDADSPESMKIAAIALMAGSMDIKPYLDSIVPLRDRSAGSHQEDLDLLLATGYIGAEQPAPALGYVTNLLKDEPDSTTALALAGQAYAMNGDSRSWKELLTPRLTRKPSDPDLLRQQMRLQAAQHDYAAARTTAKSIFDSGHATSNDYNGYAWLGLFDNHLGPDVTDAAQQATTISKNGTFGDLHTTACVYAAQGKATEAQQVLNQAMTAGNLSQPNSEVWYALGLLYEDYGLRDAALAAYHRVQAHPFDDHAFVDAQSTYLLAQQGLHRLNTAPHPGQ